MNPLLTSPYTDYTVWGFLVNKVWQNITIRQTRIPPNFYRLQYLLFGVSHPPVAVYALHC